MNNNMTIMLFSRGLDVEKITIKNLKIIFS